MNWRSFLFAWLVVVGVPAPLLAQDFNDYILKSVDDLYPRYAKGGYDLNQAFTHDIYYGDRGKVKASSPQKTMCVAAVAEVIINAIRLYAASTGDETVFEKIPVTAWTQGNVLSLRANIFMFAGTGSRGTGHTLAEFQLGEELRFQDLKPGDFINLNRTNKSGHAVVFLNFLRPDLTLSKSYVSDAIGFRYFSAQGRPDDGFGVRNAFFEGSCPTSPVPRDCGVIRSSNQVLFNGGRMWDPSRWAYREAVAKRRVAARSILEQVNPQATRGTIEFLLDQELQKELKWSPEQAKAFANEMPE